MKQAGLRNRQVEALDGRATRLGHVIIKVHWPTEPIEMVLSFARSMRSPESGTEMRRRDFLAKAGGIAAGWPLDAQAQKTLLG